MGGKSKRGRLELVSMSEEAKELEGGAEGGEGEGWFETKLCYSGQVLHGIPRLSPLYDPFTTTTCSYFDKTPGPSPPFRAVRNP